MVIVVPVSSIVPIVVAGNVVVMVAMPHVFARVVVVVAGIVPAMAPKSMSAVAAAMVVRIMPSAVIVPAVAVIPSAIPSAVVVWITYVHVQRTHAKMNPLGG